MPTPPGVKNSQRLLAVFAAVLATVICAYGAGMFGIVGSLLYLLLAVPVAYVYMRFGCMCGVGAFVLTVCALSVQYGLSNVLVEYVVMFGFPSLTLPMLLRRGWRWDLAVTITVIATVVFAAGLVAMMSAGEGTTVSALSDHYVETQLELVREFFTTGQDLTPELQRDLRLSLQEVEQRFRQTYLAFHVVGYAAFTLFQLWLLALLSGRHYIIPGGAFVSWRAPEHLVWGLIVSGFAFFVGDGLLRQGGLNILIVILMAYYVQGLAVITDLFERKQFPMFLRAMGYAMTIILGPLPFAGIGVFDIWIDFRKKRIKGNEPF
jgi:uncharacterized protein YybS (DUF2232 family)